MKTLKDAEVVTPAQLVKMTPPEIDEHFAAVWDERYVRQEKLYSSWDSVLRAAGAKHDRYGWSLTLSEAAGKAENLAQEDPKGRAAQALAHMREMSKAVDALDPVLKKLDKEFNRRGQWNRAYLVITNGKGHIHKSMRCSTCNNGATPTQFHWMIEWSGKNEEDIVEAAGIDACSVCYPSAPVARGMKAPKRTMFAPFEIERDKVRAKRAADKEKREAAKEAKAIYDSNGGPLKVYNWTRKAHQKRVAGKLIDVPEEEFFETIKTLHAARGWLTDQFDTFYGSNGQHRDLDKVADAVGIKEGKPRSVVIDEAKKRAAKRK